MACVLEVRVSDSQFTRPTWFLPQDHPRAEYEARVLEKSLRKESKNKEVRWLLFLAFLA